MAQLHREVRNAILAKYDKQADFAQALRVDRTLISFVLRSRRKLSPEQAACWAKLLNCDQKLLEPVTKAD